MRTMKVNRFMLKIALRHMVRGDKKMHEGLPVPSMEKKRLAIAPNDQASDQQKYDIYYAAEPNGVTIIDIHGGAYIYSSRKNNVYFAKYFLDRGFNVVELDYRLNRGSIDTHDQVRDLAAELKHLFDRAEEYGLDPTKMVLTGDSAGGHFSLILAEMIYDREVAKKIGVDLEGVSIKCVAVNCPVYRFVEIGKGDALTKGAKKFMVGPRFADYEYQALVCPEANFHALRHPIFISTCKNDFIREESLMLVEDLKKANLPYAFKDILADEPEVAHVHNVIRPYLEQSKVVNEAMVEFFLASIENK